MYNLKVTSVIAPHRIDNAEVGLKISTQVEAPGQDPIGTAVVFTKEIMTEPAFLDYLLMDVSRVIKRFYADQAKKAIESNPQGETA